MILFTSNLVHLFLAATIFAYIFERPQGQLCDQLTSVSNIVCPDDGEHLPMKLQEYKNTGGSFETFCQRKDGHIGYGKQ